VGTGVWTTTGTGVGVVATTTGTGVAVGLGFAWVVALPAEAWPKGSQLTLPLKGSQEVLPPWSQVT